MTRLEELSQRYHTHPDEGGDYLSLDELNELCHLQNCEIKQLHHKVAVKHRRTFAAERAEQEATREIDRLRLALQSIAIYWQDEKPQRDDRDSPFDWRRCSTGQEDIARDTLKGQWPPGHKPDTNDRPDVDAALDVQRGQ